MPGGYVLILAPVKNASPFLETYLGALSKLSYPRELISAGFLESDSRDDTYKRLTRHAAGLSGRYRRVGVWKRDFGFEIPPRMPGWSPQLQAERRTILARSRNHLLSRALADEDWVLWIDADVLDYPADIIERLLATDKDIVHPHCLIELRDTPRRTFDLNAWRDQGRLHMDDLRAEGDLVRLDSVGGTMLLVRADAHRDGLIFPPFWYGTRNPLIRDHVDHSPAGEGEIETEGLGLMAGDGVQWVQLRPTSGTDGRPPRSGSSARQTSASARSTSFAGTAHADGAGSSASTGPDRRCRHDGP